MGMSTDALPLPDPTLLPDDPAVLKQLVVQSLEELQKANARLERQEHHMHLLLKRIYGSTSEKFDPRQGVLFDSPPGVEETDPSPPVPPPAASAVSKNRDKHGRGRIPDETEREEVVHDLSEAEKAALGGVENLVELPPETSEQLDWRPSTLTDDTSVKIRDAWRKLKHTGRFWPYVGDPLHPLTVFDYTTTHQRDGPAAFLKDYRGYLQADAFNGYDGIYLESQGRIIEVACWAHARRKFHESRRLDAVRMETALAWIGKLYAVEKDLRERCQGEWEKLALDQRAVRIVAERQERSRPLLNSFHTWLEVESPKVLPKSPVRGAMDYTLSNWTALSVYPDDGWLDIDNNEGENSLRGLCIGRRNWLFCGSDRGGYAAAVHFSLLASCKRHGHDPWVYLRDVLTRLPAMLPGASDEELLALLPHLWKPA
jgi:hypothetical protein